VLFVSAGDALKRGVKEGERRVVGVAGRELTGPGGDVQWILVVLARRWGTRRPPTCLRLLRVLVREVAVAHGGEQLRHGPAQHVLQHPAGIRAGQSQ
jgi:hypothetical protein